jgi:hypothetical protein
MSNIQEAITYLKKKYKVQPAAYKLNYYSMIWQSMSADERDSEFGEWVFGRIKWYVTALCETTKQ